MNRDEAIQATLDALNQPMARGDSSDYLTINTSQSSFSSHNSRPNFHSRRSSIMAQLSTPNHHARTPSISMSDSDLSCMDEHKRRSRISIDFSGLYSPASSAGDWCEKELLSPDPEIESLDKKRSSKGSEFFKRWSLGPSTSVTQVSRQTQALLSPQEFHTAEFEPQSCMWQRTLQEMARTDNTRLALLARNSNANSYPLQSMHSKKRHSCDFTSSTTASNGLGLGLGPLRASTPVKGPSNNSFVPFSFETGSEETPESPVHTKLKHRTSMSRTRPLSMTRSTSQKFNSGNFSLRQRAGTPTPVRDDDDNTQVDSFRMDDSADMSSDSNTTAVDPLDTKHTRKDDDKLATKAPLDPTIPITDWSQKAQLIKLICASIQDAPTMMAYVNLLWTALSNPENLNLDKIDIVPGSLEDVVALQDNLVQFVSEVDVKAMVSAGWIRFYKVMYSSAVVSATIGLLAFQTVLLLLYLCVASVIILGSSILHRFEKTQPQEAAKVPVKECKEE